MTETRKFSPKEKVWESLSVRYERARDTAQSLEHSEKQDEAEADLINDFLSGKISLAEYHASDSTQRSSDGVLELQDLSELKSFLDQLLNDESLAQELYEHESEHHAEITAVGWKAKIIFRFFEDFNGDLSGRPGIDLEIPKVGDEIEIRRILRSILEAPEEQSDLDSRATR